MNALPTCAALAALVLALVMNPGAADHTCGHAYRDDDTGAA